MENVMYGLLGTVGICTVAFIVGTIIGLGKEGFERLAQTKRFQWLSKL
jgi:hypothetical protein